MFLTRTLEKFYEMNLFIVDILFNLLTEHLLHEDATSCIVISPLRFTASCSQQFRSKDFIIEAKVVLNMNTDVY